MERYDPQNIHSIFPFDSYDSPRREIGEFTRTFPSLGFYGRILPTVTVWAINKARKGLLDDTMWVYISNWIVDVMERSGFRIHVDGLDNVRSLGGRPCVFVGNHMSTLETYILPAMLEPIQPITFVVKRSLITMPGFGHIMRSRNPVVVDRRNPREDLTTILREGCERLEKGISVVVFPQSTRQRYLDEKHFNTIGVKLARKAGVPVVPLALKTDTWGVGTGKLKEFGPINIKHDVSFRFFPPVEIKGPGRAEHAAILSTIKTTLEHWENRQIIIDRGGLPVPF